MNDYNLPLVHAKSDLDNMPPDWRKEFEAEVAANNFLLGGKCVLLRGPGACNASRHWIAALLLGGYQCYRITPFEAIRRADGKPVMGDTDERQRAFLKAECVLIDDFFDPDAKALSAEMVYLFGWFLIELIRAGITVIIACDTDEPDMDYYSDRIWDVVETNFEVIKNGDQTAAKKTKPKAVPRKALR